MASLTNLVAYTAVSVCQWAKKNSIAIVLCAKGYPSNHIKNSEIKNLYNIVVKLIDSNREAKDEVKKTMTGVNVMKDIMIKLFRNGKK